MRAKDQIHRMYTRADLNRTNRDNGAAVLVKPESFLLSFWVVFVKSGKVVQIGAYYFCKK